MVSGSLFNAILRGSSLSLLGRLVFTAASFVITSITALWYGADVVGVVATMTTVVTFLGILANAGTSTSINSYVATPFAAGSTRAARRAYRQIIAICLIGAVTLAIALALAGGGWAERSLNGVSRLSPAMVLFLAALAVPLRVMSEMTTLAMRTLDRIPAFVVLTVAPALVNLLVLIVGILSGRGPDVAIWGFFAGLGMAAVVGFCWVACVFDAVSPWSTKALSSRVVAQVASPVAMLQHSFPMLISTISAYGITASGLLIMSYFAASAETGHFSVALRMATVTSLVLTSINVIVTPIFARLFVAKDTSELLNVARSTARMMFWAVVPVIILIGIFGKSLLGLAFGQGFEAAYLPLLILLAGQLVNTITGPSDALMNMAGMQRTLRNILFPAAVMSVVLGLILVPSMGALGAALAYSIAMLFWRICSAVALKRSFGGSIWYFPFFCPR